MKASWRRLSVAAFGLALAVGVSQTAQSNHSLCEGFLPENNLRIPVGTFSDKGLNQADYNEVLDRVQKIYAPIVRSQGGTLKINRLWSNDTVNASAQQMGSTYVINMYGGLARHPAITQDGFLLVACHELGHHLGGAPKIGSGWFNSWASNEGQSDYFANLRCFRRIFSDAENIKWLRANRDSVSSYALSECERVYSGQAEQAICIRSAMAGFSVTSLFRDLRSEDPVPRFETPDQREVRRTDDNHPATQCRLDSYFQGALCDKGTSGELSDSDPVSGTCTRQAGYLRGIRPLCWYRP